VGVPFRDDRDALLARADALAAENARLRRERDEAVAARDEAAAAQDEAAAAGDEAAASREPGRAPEDRAVPAPARAHRPRRRPGARPTWVIVVAVPLTAAYVLALALHLATLALGRDPSSLPAMVWYLGPWAVLLPSSYAMPGRASRTSRIAQAPRWLVWLAVAHFIYLATLLVALSAKFAVPQIVVVQSLALSLLSAGTLMTWYGDWD
jgi:hypothetical protein